VEGVEIKQFPRRTQLSRIPGNCKDMAPKPGGSTREEEKKEEEEEEEED